MQGPPKGSSILAPNEDKFLATLLVLGKSFLLRQAHLPSICFQILRLKQSLKVFTFSCDTWQFLAFNTDVHFKAFFFFAISHNVCFLALICCLHAIYGGSLRDSLSLRITKSAISSLPDHRFHPQSAS